MQIISFAAIVFQEKRVYSREILFSMHFIQNTLD